MQDCTFHWWLGKNCYSLAGKFWFIHCIHQTFHLQISIYSSLYKILLMEKTSIPWKTVKNHLEQFFVQKDKKFWEDGITKLPEKWQNIVEQNWICRSIKFLVKMKNMSFLFTWRSVLDSLTDSSWFPTLWISLFFFLNFLLWKEIQNHRLVLSSPPSAYFLTTFCVVYTRNRNSF